MKNLFKHCLCFLSLFIFTQVQFSCSKDNIIEDRKLENKFLKTTELTFPIDNSTEKFYLKNNIWEPISDKIIKKVYKNNSTGELIYTYSKNNSLKKFASTSYPDSTLLDSTIKIDDIIKQEYANQIIIERGLFGWNGRCFIWGTVVRNEQGVELFFPADFQTQQMLNVCPGNGQSFAKVPKK